MLALFEYFWSYTSWVPIVGKGVFVNPVSRVMPNFVAPLSSNSIAVIFTVSGNIVLPMSGQSNLTVSAGYVHIRSSSVDPSTITALKITGTDLIYGSTVVLGQLPATAAGDAVDWTVPFNTDLKLKSITVAVTLSGSAPNARFDVEAAGG